MKCPMCRKENENLAFKTWDYGPYHVLRYQCSECGEYFNTYEKDGAVKFTVPKI